MSTLKIKNEKKYSALSDIFMKFTLMDLLSELIHNLKVILSVPLLVGIIVYLYTLTLPLTFTAKTSILPPTQKSSLGSIAGAFGGTGILSAIAGDSKSDYFIALMKSNLIKDKIIERFQLIDRFKTIANAREYIEGGSTFSLDVKSGLILIGFTDNDPKLAAEIANGYIEALSSVLFDFNRNESRFMAKNMQSKIDQIYSQNFKSVLVRDFMLQSALREYELKKYSEYDRQFIQQIDKAEPPFLRSGPKRMMLTLFAISITAIAILLLIMIRLLFRPCIAFWSSKISFRKI